MKNTGLRLGFMTIITLVLAVVCTVRLFDLQIIKGSGYEAQANQRLVLAHSITAPRGEIVDRNGRPIVENKMGYNVRIQKMDISDEELNSVLCRTAYLVGSFGSEIESVFPVIINENTDKLDYDFKIEENSKTSEFLKLFFDSLANSAPIIPASRSPIPALAIPAFPLWLR